MKGKILLCSLLLASSIKAQQIKSETGLFTYVSAMSDPVENGCDIEMKSEKGEGIIFHHRDGDKTHFEKMLFKKPSPEAMDTLTKPGLIGKKYDVMYLPAGKLANGWMHGKIMDIVPVDSVYPAYTGAYGKFSKDQLQCESKNKTAAPIPVLNEMIKAMKADGMAGCGKFMNPDDARGKEEVAKYAAMKNENPSKYAERKTKLLAEIEKNEKASSGKTVLYVSENRCYVSWGSGWDHGAVALLDKVNGKWYVTDPFDGRWEKEFKDGLGLTPKMTEHVLQRWLKQKYQCYELNL